MNIPYFTGHVILKTELSLVQLGDLLSTHLFNSIPFSPSTSGRFEEVPTLILDQPILGYEILLHGPSEFSEHDFFSLAINGPDIRSKSTEKWERVKIDLYLKAWVCEQLSKEEHVEVLEM
jgi:hypothetical protein